MDRFDRAGTAFAELCRLMARLRAPGGCPWDRAQSTASLIPFLVEETYEVVDAMEAGDSAAQREELGDLLLQVVFQAEIATEEGAFDMEAVVKAISEKLLLRHPHVFGPAHADDAGGALRQWEAVKAQTNPERRSRLDGIPSRLPALLRATRTGEKAAVIGFDWPDAAGARAKAEEEWGELFAAVEQQEGQTAVEQELGDLLFSVVNLARHLDVDAESALRGAVDKFGYRFRHVEQRLAEMGIDPAEVALDRLEELWQEAKSSMAQKCLNRAPGSG